jgi:hypothetical protein
MQMHSLLLHKLFYYNLQLISEQTPGKARQKLIMSITDTQYVK